MPTTLPSSSPSADGTTLLGSKLMNIFVSPTDVFDEVAGAPHRFGNWLVPFVLVCLTSLLLLGFTSDKERVQDFVRVLAEKDVVPQLQSSSMAGSWAVVSALALCLGAAVGAFWSALVLWTIGKVFLKSSFSFGKSLEIIGLASTIMALGAVVTLGIVAATGDPGARPALSMFAGRIPAESPLVAVLAATNVFHIWSLGVVTLGLSRVGKVSAKEAGFWVFGYWFFGRIALALLS